jgi:hypothetical protein
MMVYAIAAILSVILAAVLNVRSCGDINFRRATTYAPLLPFLLVAVLRSAVGKDTVGEWSTYTRVFGMVQAGYSYHDVFSVVRVEPLYYALNWVTVAAGADVDVIYAVMSAIFLIFMYRFILERSVNIPLSLFLLFASDLYVFSLSGIRQAAACGIAFFALRYAQERRPFVYFAWIAVAIGLHFTALLFVLFYFVARRRVSAVGATLLVLVGAVSMLSPDTVRRFSAIYYGAVYFGSKWDYSNFNLIPALVAAVIVLAALARSREIMARDASMQLYFNIMVANLFLMAISSLLITPIRLYFLLIPAAFVLVPATVASIPRTRGPVRLLLATALIGVISLQMVYELAIGNDAYGTWNYEWVFGAANE